MAEFKVGDRVEIVSNASNSKNPIGRVGVITFIDRDGDIRVMVEGYTDNNMVNWQIPSELELVQD